MRTGLHFNLTEGRPLAPSLRALWPRLPTLQDLIVQAHLRRLPLAELVARAADGGRQGIMPVASPRRQDQPNRPPHDPDPAPDQ